VRSLTNVLSQLGFAVLILFPLSASAGALTAERLRCEYLDSPLGIDVTEPRLSWELRATDENVRGLRQSAYQVQVASSPERLARDQGDLWDTGKVQSGQSTQVAYAGQELKSQDVCYWKVRVWDGADQPSSWSEAARWSMGLLQRSDWTGHWIAAPREPDIPWDFSVFSGILAVRQASY